MVPNRIVLLTEDEEEQVQGLVGIGVVNPPVLPLRRPKMKLSLSVGF